MTQPISSFDRSVAGSKSPRSSPTSSSATTDATTTRCRYKTGRCSNARVVKPNGSLLLLCEYHRNQQNRTKKRSDMKYRHHRAKKRQMERLQPSHLPLPSVAHALPLQPPPAVSRPHIPPPSPSTVSTQQTLSPTGSTPTLLASSPCLDKQPLVYTPDSAAARCGGLSYSLSKKSTTLYKISSGLRAAAMGSRISPGKARMGALRSRSLVGAFGTSRRDIVAMASPHKLHVPPSHPGAPAAHRSTRGVLRSPAVGAANAISLATRSNGMQGGLYFQHEPPPPPPRLALSPPLCLSPLRHDSPWAARGVSVWQPDDVRLLGYFIL